MSGNFRDRKDKPAKKRFHSKKTSKRRPASGSAKKSFRKKSDRGGEKGRRFAKPGQDRYDKRPKNRKDSESKEHFERKKREIHKPVVKQPLNRSEAVSMIETSFQSASFSEERTWPMRINRYLAHAGYGSRREAEALVTAGDVTVNSQKVTALDTKIQQGDVVRVKGKTAVLPNDYTYIAFHKPPGYIVSRKPFPGQPVIYELLPETMRSLKYAGRLDQNSRGLVLLSDDGNFIQQISHPAKRVLKKYLVKSAQLPSERELQIQFYKGVEDKGELLRAIGVRIVNRTESVVEIVLHEGKNRHIRRMFQAVELPVYDLFRTAIGHVSLDRKAIPEGSYTTFQPQEVFDAGSDSSKNVLQDFDPWSQA